MKKLKRAIKMVAFNTIFINLSMAYPMYLSGEVVGNKYEIEELPTIGRFLYEFIVFVLIHEVTFYYAHRFVNTVFSTTHTSI